MTSCEPTRCSAYSEDLRWRIVWQTEALRYTSDQVASNLGNDKSTVNRIRQRWCTSGSLKKKVYAKDKAYRKLTVPAQLLVLHLVINKPGIFLREVQSELFDVLMLEVDTSRFLDLPDRSCAWLLYKETNFCNKNLCWMYPFISLICLSS